MMVFKLNEHQLLGIPVQSPTVNYCSRSMRGFTKYYNIYQLFTHRRNECSASIGDYNYDFPCYIIRKGENTTCTKT